MSKSEGPLRAKNTRSSRLLKLYNDNKRNNQSQNQIIRTRVIQVDNERQTNVDDVSKTHNPLTLLNALYKKQFQNQENPKLEADSSTLENPYIGSQALPLNSPKIYFNDPSDFKYNTNVVNLRSAVRQEVVIPWEYKKHAQIEQNDTSTVSEESDAASPFNGSLNLSHAADQFWSPKIPPTVYKKSPKTMKNNKEELYIPENPVYEKEPVWKKSFLNPHQQVEDIVEKLVLRLAQQQVSQNKDSTSKRESRVIETEVKENQSSVLQELVENCLRDMIRSQLPSARFSIPIPNFNSSSSSEEQLFKEEAQILTPMDSPKEKSPEIHFIITPQLSPSSSFSALPIQKALPFHQSDPAKAEKNEGDPSHSYVSLSVLEPPFSPVSSIDDPSTLQIVTPYSTSEEESSIQKKESRKKKVHLNLEESIHKYEVVQGVEEDYLKSTSEDISESLSYTLSFGEVKEPKKNMKKPEREPFVETSDSSVSLGEIHEKRKFKQRNRIKVNEIPSESSSSFVQRPRRITVIPI